MFKRIVDRIVCFDRGDDPAAWDRCQSRFAALGLTVKLWPQLEARAAPPLRGHEVAHLRRCLDAVQWAWEGGLEHLMILNGPALPSRLAAPLSTLIWLQLPRGWQALYLDGLHLGRRRRVRPLLARTFFTVEPSAYILHRRCFRQLMDGIPRRHPEQPLDLILARWQYQGRLRAYFCPLPWNAQLIYDLRWSHA